jgi:hypothetical protein
MTKEESLKNIFNTLKEKGLFTQYKDYNDYLKKTGQKQDQRKEQARESYQRFLKSLNEEERKDYEDAFEK